MNNSTLAMILIGVAVFSLFRVVSQWRGLGRQKPLDWDEQFITQLRKAGVNAFEDQRVDFFFTLPTQQACEEIATLLRADGYEVVVRPAEAGDEFGLHAQRAMRLVVPEMQALTARFRQLAEERGGKYDNWAVARK
jgi:hypothetical protein